MKYTLGDLSIDTGRQLVSRAGDPILLPKLSFDLLLALVRAAPNVVSLDELMRLVWSGLVVSPETVSQRVKLLRDALGDAPQAPRYIASLRGRGYQVVASVQEIGDTPKSGPYPMQTSDTTDHEQLSAGSSLGTTVTCDHMFHADAAEATPEHSAPSIAPARIAICVLPFANMSDDPEQEYFSDGITEDIITELSRWRLLAVRSRSASFQFRGVSVDMKQVARDLNVRFIIEGSVRRLGSRIRVNVQLIDSETGSHVWAEKFDREAAQIFSVQDQVVQTIVSTLVGQVRLSDVERARRKPTNSLLAYECVLKGNALPWDDPKSLAEATRLFKKAMEIDPGYGHAHALLAAVCCTEWQDDLSSSDIALGEALVLAKRAVQLDERESTCFSLLGWTYLLRRTFDLALQYTGRAVAMNPNNQWNAADIGSVLLYVGRAEESLVWFKRARDIDPYFNEPWYWRCIGFAHMILDRYQEALAVFDYLSARTYRIAAYTAGCHARLGEIGRARVSAAECLAMKPDFRVAHFMSKHPFKNPTDAARLAESLLMAALPG
jgi:TolB-like protein/DNA-binding winged helix-turn-helix (wHTH) protein/tetratricopeptide (TPR) repeat protein